MQHITVGKKMVVFQKPYNSQVLQKRLLKKYSASDLRFVLRSIMIFHLFSIPNFLLYTVFSMSFGLFQTCTRTLHCDFKPCIAFYTSSANWTWISRRDLVMMMTMFSIFKRTRDDLINSKYGCKLIKGL